MGGEQPQGCHLCIQSCLWNSPYSNFLMEFWVPGYFDSFWRQNQCLWVLHCWIFKNLILYMHVSFATSLSSIFFKSFLCITNAHMWINKPLMESSFDVIAPLLCKNLSYLFLILGYFKAISSESFLFCFTSSETAEVFQNIEKREYPFGLHTTFNIQHSLQIDLV